MTDLLIDGKSYRLKFNSQGYLAQKLHGVIGWSSKTTTVKARSHCICFMVMKQDETGQ